jgi:hypothetical protein
MAAGASKTEKKKRLCFVFLNYFDKSLQPLALAVRSCCNDSRMLAISCSAVTPLSRCPKSLHRTGCDAETCGISFEDHTIAATKRTLDAANILQCACDNAIAKIDDKKLRLERDDAAKCLE